MVHNYAKYTLHSVYGQLDEELQKEIVAFWAKNQAITDPREAWRRTREVVFVIRNSAADIVGISSAYVAALPDNKNYYFYRMFIQPADRVAGMMTAVTNGTRDFLRELAVPDKPAGMIIITENAKLMRKGMRRLFASRGYIYMGETPAGLDVWKAEFG